MAPRARLTREQVFARDAFCCVYCGARFEPDELTVDHVEARARGGDHSGGNVVSACAACNLEKGDARVADFLREDPVARANFMARAAAYVWPRIVRALEQELARPPRRR